MATIYAPSLVGTYAPGVLMLCVAIGAFLLWKRTRRVSAFIQVVAASVVFMDELLTRVFMITSGLWFWWEEPVKSVRDGAVKSALMIFPVAYLWYASTQKASNHAMERTTDRSATNS